MSLIQVRDLSFAYEGSSDKVFEAISFQIDSDWKLGLTGRNGRGKTTLLKLLRGDYPYEGSIRASVAFQYFPDPVLHPDWLCQKVLEEIDPTLPRWKLLREMAALELGEELLYRPFATLSGGEQTKLLLALLFLREDSFPLIDEPTNHLDRHGRDMLSAYLKKKRGFILVSHDRAFLDGCVDHILSINRADIEVQRGTFSSWWENRQRQDSFEQAENEKLKKEIGRLKEAAREKAAWSDRVERSKIGQGTFDRGYVGHQSARMMARSKAIEKRREAAAEEKSRLLKNVESAAELKLAPLLLPGKRILEVRDLQIDYGAGPVCGPLRFELLSGECLALLGGNGTGKSSVLKLICGEAIPHSGYVERLGGLRLSYVPQDSSFLRGALRDYAAECGIEESLFFAILRKLGFERVQFEKDLRELSAGQRKKVLIARSLCQQAHLYVWDEPMNYIDVISRMQIEQLLRRFRPTLLLVEHDRAFCEAVADRQIDLSSGEKLV